MAKDRLLRVEEVALQIGVSVQSINVWYRWARQNSDNEYAKILPQYIQTTSRSVRYWRQSDIWKLLEFKASIPHGRNGVLGSVTQKYVKSRKDK